MEFFKLWYKMTLNHVRSQQQSRVWLCYGKRAVPRARSFLSDQQQGVTGAQQHFWCEAAGILVLYVSNYCSQSTGSSSPLKLSSGEGKKLALLSSAFWASHVSVALKVGGVMV